MYDGLQVGFVRPDGLNRACLWTGSADSWEDLGAALEPSLVWSAAMGVWSDGSTIFVSGFASDLAGRNEAVLWTRPIPAPGTALIVIAAGGVIARRRGRREC